MAPKQAENPKRQRNPEKTTSIPAVTQKPEKTNEELMTINNDMQNLLNATGVATVFLDGDLQIRRFNPAATRLFKFIDSDVGRLMENITTPLKDNLLVKPKETAGQLIYELGNRQWDIPELRKILKEVLEKESDIELISV